MTEMVAGLIGAAIGIGLFWLGRLTAEKGLRRPLSVSRGARERGCPTMLPLSPKEWEAFLKYDGTVKTGEEAQVHADQGR